ncbi:MAG: 4Fe-4S dicluster domain-containing protein [Pseudomonadota bacterium]
MTTLPPKTKKKLGLAIDLDICVGCHACVTSCKEWNSSALTSTPLSDFDPYGQTPYGTFLNRVHAFEIVSDQGHQQVYFPRSCLHCEEPDCVSVCPTGASYKREEDGIVLVNPDHCIGCKLCSWACPYGAREYDEADGVMKKCTLCVDRLYNENIDEQERKPACVLACPTGARHFGDFGDEKSEISTLSKDRGGFGLLEEFGYKPVNQYLPPRAKRDQTNASKTHHNTEVTDFKSSLKKDDLQANQGHKKSHIENFFRWVDRTLSDEKSI